MKNYLMLTLFTMISFNYLSAYNREYDRSIGENWLRAQAQDAEKYKNEEYMRRR